MPLTLKNYAKELTKELLQLAEKNPVRECDETPKGRFVAYVDEGTYSFDVSLNILPNGEVSQSTCDCKSPVPFCRHKAALLIHIARDKKVKDTVKIKKKESQADRLLDEIEFGALKDWVQKLIEENKDIQLAFTHHFAAKKQQYTPEEVLKLIKDAIKATGATKKNIDTTLIKKLVELWTKVLEPVIQHYQANVMDLNAFQIFHTLIESCLQFQSGITGSSSARIPKFIGDILHQSEKPVNDLVNNEAWDKATGFFIDNVPDGTNNIRMYYLLHLQNIIAASNSDRREKLIALLAAQFKKSTPEHLINGALYTKAIFGIIETNNLIPSYLNLFKPLYFDNAFNEKLITLLIENNQLALAEKYCENQIKGNYKEEYNVPYWKLLKEIYFIRLDDKKLANIKKELFPYTYDFDDYLFIFERLDYEEAKKWRTKVLTRARNARYNTSNGALEFCFKLADHDKNYKKMIDYIDSYTTYDIIFKYFEPMVSAGKEQLFKAIVNKSDDSLFGFSRAAIEEKHLQELFSIVKKYYTAAYLKQAINQTEKKSYYFRLNRFMAYAKEQLNKD